MTVAVVSRYQNFVGAGLTGPYTFNFPILISSGGTPYITVTKIDASGVSTVLAYPGDYTFSAVQLGLGGGIVTTAVAVPGDGSRLFIEGATPLDQSVKFSNQGDFFPETHEKSYDKLHYITQEATRYSGTAVRIPTTDVTGTSTTLPTAAARANKVMAFDSDGNVTVSSVSLADIELVRSLATQAEAEAASNNTKFVSTLRVKQYVDYLFANSAITLASNLNVGGNINLSSAAAYYTINGNAALFHNGGYTIIQAYAGTGTVQIGNNADPKTY